MLTFAAFFVAVRTSCAFLFNSPTDINHCYELDLENCFREAFLAAIHPPIRGRRATPFFQSANSTVLDKRKTGDSTSTFCSKHSIDRANDDLDSTNLMLCHDVRRFSLCFHYPGCSEQIAAAVASVQYHMVFGKKLPLHVFLAYKGYGRQVDPRTN
ncbi:unnamed protein product [Heligmosomoides polygyrus]|uniref:Secreted protein n=1 Tax=Heligmosomoides polygyrus TaxID=6339 RepID=A0A3P7ZBH1_HELPZ|nr:unnamed protein product [Heligmosomoides polygyrus]